MDELKYLKIYNEIKQNIINKKYSLGQKLPTEDNLCRMFDVSKQSVRRAITKLQDERYVKRRQGSGTYVVYQESAGYDSVAVVISYLSNYIFPSIVGGIEEVFTKNNYSFMLFQTKNSVAKEALILKSLIGKNISGLIIEGAKSYLPNPNIKLYQQLTDKKIPIIFINSIYSELNFPYVIMDDYNGAYNLTQYLINKGHRKICCILKNDDVQGIKRYSGFINCITDNEVRYDDKCVFLFTDSYGYKGIINEMVKSNYFHKYSAVICYNDPVALYLEQKLMTDGYNVPKDISIISFDNSELSDFAPVRITSMIHPKKNMGKIAAQMLISEIKGVEQEPVMLPWTINEKDSIKDIIYMPQNNV